MQLRDRKQLEDKQAMNEASRLYRPPLMPLERNPRNLWKRNVRAILGTITGRVK